MRPKQDKFKTIALIVIIISILCIQSAMANPASINSVAKVYRNCRYIIFINYETSNKETDNLVFKVHCEFDKGESVFTSSSLNGLKRGRHSTKLHIPEGARKQYGSLRSYSASVYKNGILLDTKKTY